MTGAKVLAVVAGLAAAGAGGSALVDKGATPPAQTHPGQPVPRTGAPANGGSVARASSPGHGASQAPPSDPHEHDEHASSAPMNGHDEHGEHAQGDSHTAGYIRAGDDNPVQTTPPAQQDTLAPTYSGTTPDAPTAIQILQDGNERWVSGHPQAPNSDAATRRETALSGQHPFATILTCADSRIPVERVFDRGVGELFVLRVAGNVVSETEAGTIEYGVDHLHTPVIVVMGHTGCGAVSAACQGGEAHGNVRFLLDEITPAVRRATTLHPTSEGGELVDFAVRENVMQSMFDLLATSESVRTAVDRGDVQLVGAIYDLSSGKVEFLGEHPWQDGLISVMNERGPVSSTPRHQMTAEVTGGREGH